MQKFKRILSAFLCILVVATCCVGLNAKAVAYPVKAEIKNAYNKNVAQIYSLPGTTGHETEENKGKSEKLTELENGTVVTVLEEAFDGDGDKWYKINYGANLENVGYAYSIHVVLKPEYQFDGDFEKQLENFPESYREALRTLHAKYPNWLFIADTLDLDFNTAVDLQYSPSDATKRKKMVEFTFGGAEWRDARSYNSEQDAWVQTYTGWTYASRAAIAYYVDPRNYLDENSIFAFLQQPYNKDLQNKEGLRTVVANTFLERGYDGDADAYLDDIMLAAEKSGVNPYVLAAAIMVEVGVDGSTVTSGTYPGYEGYYNFYNWNATGSDVIGNALQFAKDNGWDSREKAIVGGAERYAKEYIASGQNTFYYKNYNYVKQPYADHQYAESIYGSITDASRISKGFLNDTNKTVIFEIPIFQNMGDTPSPVPSKPETPPEIVEPTPDEPTPDEPTPTPPPEPVIKKGDTNGDNNINAVDLAAVKMSILGVKGLEGNAAKAADVNGDGVINAVDLAAIKMHILGVKPIN